MPPIEMNLNECDYILTNVIAAATSKPVCMAVPQQVPTCLISTTGKVSHAFATRRSNAMTQLPDHLPQASLERAFIAAWPAEAWRDVHVVLAVSGGPDSVAMMRAAVAVKEQAGGAGRLFAAHLNHGIRPDEAAADEAWLRELCGQLNVPLEVGHSNVLALAETVGDGLEAAARQARYDFLQTTAEKLGARFVAVAHTADDQVETILHRILRGTGVTGLAGMPRTRPLSPTVTLVRPLLHVQHDDVLAYLARLGQDFCVDATNTDVRHTRNRLRHELLPLLRGRFNPDVHQALLRLATQAEETQQLLSTLTGDLAQKSVRHSAQAFEIDCAPLATQPPLLVRELCKTSWTSAGWPLQDMGFNQWQQLAELVQSDASDGPINLPAGVRAERRGNCVHLARSAVAS
jgi:tRNA(Ile)-lysidine synthase